MKKEKLKEKSGNSSRRSRLDRSINEEQPSRGSRRRRTDENKSEERARKEKQERIEREEMEEERRQEEEARTRQVFDPIQKIYNEQKRRVTDLPECGRVTLPKPLPVSEEALIELRR